MDCFARVERMAHSEHLGGRDAGSKRTAPALACNHKAAMARDA
jgi:hypothetical protein